MITYTHDLVKSFPLGKMSFHQCLSSYYKDISVAIIIKEFHQVKVVKLTVIMNYICDLFESFTLGRTSFNQLLMEYHKDIGVAISIKKFHHISVIKLISVSLFLAIFSNINKHIVHSHFCITLMKE